MWANPDTIPIFQNQNFEVFWQMAVILYFHMIKKNICMLKFDIGTKIIVFQAMLGPIYAQPTNESDMLYIHRVIQRGVGGLI